MSTENREILTFGISGRVFGVWLDSIDSVTSAPEIGFSHAALVPAVFAGLMSVRGKAVAVLDGGMILLNPENPVSHSGCSVILFSFCDRQVGFAVDYVGEVYSSGKGTITPLSGDLSDIFPFSFSTSGGISFDIADLCAIVRKTGDKKALLAQ